MLQISGFSAVYTFLFCIFRQIALPRYLVPNPQPGKPHMFIPFAPCLLPVLFSPAAASIEKWFLRQWQNPCESPARPVMIIRGLLPISQPTQAMDTRGDG